MYALNYLFSYDVSLLMYLFIIIYYLIHYYIYSIPTHPIPTHPHTHTPNTYTLTHPHTHTHTHTPTHTPTHIHTHTHTQPHTHTPTPTHPHIHSLGCSRTVHIVDPSKVLKMQLPITKPILVGGRSTVQVLTGGLVVDLALLKVKVKG